MSTRPRNETWPLPDHFQPLAEACGWLRTVRSSADRGSTWVEVPGGNVSAGHAKVPRARGDAEALLAKIPEAARAAEADARAAAKGLTEEANALLAKAAKYTADADAIQRELRVLEARTVP